MPQQLCKFSEVGKNGKEISLQTKTGTVYIMLFLHSDSIRAFHNSCPHQGRPLNFAPDRFLITPEEHLVCAHHGATFELENGECLDGPCRGSSLRSIKVFLEDNLVWLDQDI
jgi:nitrite reductase/ring-hydroxylating ferredoxin subunit